MKKKISNWMYARMILSGAIAGAAVFGLIAPHIGIDVPHVKDLVGGGIGAGIVAIGFKIAHLA